ncbi:MAG: DUF1475 family protein [Acidobacteriota bacterium]
MRTVLLCAGFLALGVMLYGTVTASLDRALWDAGPDLWQDPWFKVTIYDTYFAFLTVWAWIAYREPTWAHRLAWLVAILCLGTFAFAAYFLGSLWRLPPGGDWQDLFTPRRRPGAAGGGG